MDYYDSPPSPPRTLEDQVHVAYAHDNIHLAKILLLRLKGIHVTGDDDPRIAQVKDEDFDFCFVPFGRLMDDEEEKKLKDMHEKEVRRVRRFQRLKACERIWEQNQKRLRELKALAVKRRELQDERRRAQEQEQAEAEQHRVHARHTSRSLPIRPVVSYRLVTTPPSSPPDAEPFVYDFMPPLQSPIPTSTSPRPKHSSSKSMSPFTRPPLFDDARTVPFSAVLASMDGPLFPPDIDERKYRHRGFDLLDTLLAVSDTDEHDPKGKAKASDEPLRPIPKRQNSTGSCAACSSASSSASRRSWLSFSSSSSSSSLSTAGTTPSSSPGPSTPKPTSSLRRFLSPRSRVHASPPISMIIPDTLRCTCATTTTADRTLTRVPVSPHLAPLPVIPATPAVRTRNNVKSNKDKLKEDQERKEQGVSFTIFQNFARVVHIARGFHDAYLRAMFAVGAEAMERERDRALLVRVQLQLHGAQQVDVDIGKPRFRTKYQPGARACVGDVRVFLSSSPSASASSSSAAATTTTTATKPTSINQYTPPPIPLHRLSSSSPFDDDDDEEEISAPPSTILPCPLPYKKHFSSPPSIPQSPFRAVHGRILGSEPLVRVRNVESGVWMFIKAVENSYSEKEARGGGRGGGVWRVGGGVGTSVWAGSVWVNPASASALRGGIGKPIPREGTLGVGREKILQVAYEGIGKSSLRYEIGERYPIVWEEQEEEEERGEEMVVVRRGRERRRGSMQSQSQSWQGMSMGSGSGKIQRGRAVFVGGGTHTAITLGAGVAGGPPKWGARMGW